MIKKLIKYIKAKLHSHKKGLKVTPFLHYIPSNILNSSGLLTTFNRGPTLCGDVRIGDYCSINGPNTSILSKSYSITIGSFTSIGPGCLIMDYTHNIDRLTTSYINAKKKKVILDRPDIINGGKISIEEDVWIGVNCVIMPGVNIGRGSVIGANSVVTKDVDRYTICAGAPLKKIRMRFNDSSIAFLESTKWWELADLSKLNDIDRHLSEINKYYV